VKTNIINILPHPPAYELYFKEPRSEINWETPSGKWVGIGGEDWPDLIGREILKLTDEFNYQVWQPDLRADKIYSHQFENGLVHKLFPAQKRKKIYGFRIINQITSESILDYLKKQLSDNLILHLNSLMYSINQEIIKKFYFVPKIIQFHSKALIPYCEMRKFRKNIIANISYLKLHNLLLRNKKIFFIYNNSNNITALSKYKPLGIERIFVGCDFDFWRPADKEDAKKSLGINIDSNIFTMASRFFPLKQIDKVIEIFINIDRYKNYNFKLYIAGHGNKEYENYLKNVARPLINKGKIIFPGYLNSEKMRDLLVASDLFISASTDEGGPTSVVKAIACNTPVMCTKVGGIDEILAQYNAGILVDYSNYKEWQRKFIDILEEKLRARLLNRKIAEELFHWANIAKKFIRIYKNMSLI